MADPRILILDNDIYALGYIPDIAGINEKKTFQKDKLIANSYSLTVENYDNFFSINNSNSPFNNINWLYTPIVVYNRDEELVWDGVITAIDRNHNTKTAIIKSKNSMFKFRHEKIEYQSSAWETPADAFKNICDNADFTDYNEGSVNTSIGRYADASCKIKCNFNLSDNVTFQNAIEKLGIYGNADVYSHNNEIYFVHWIPFTGGSSIILNANERNKFKSLPQVIEDEKIMINDFNIGYDGDLGVPVTDATQNNIGAISRSKWGVHSLPETRSDDDAQIRYETSTSAIYIGEGNIRRSQKNLDTQPQPLTAIKFNLFADNKEWISLQSYFKLTLPDESWTEKIFEVFEFTINEEQDDLQILAYEVV